MIKKSCFQTLIAALLLISCNGDRDPAQAAMFHGDAMHRGVYGEVTFLNFGRVKWKFKTNGKIFSSPAVAGGVAYIGSEDSNVYAVDTTDGSERWRFHTKGPVSSSPAVWNGKVYFLSFDGSFYALDAGSGQLLWKFSTGGERKTGAYGLWTMKPQDEYMVDLYDFFLSSPVISKEDHGTTVYFGSSDGNVYALDASGGKLLWKFHTGGLIHTTPAVYNHTVYVGSWDTYLYAIDARTGKEKWKFKTKDQPGYHLLEGIQASPVIEGDLVYFGARDGYFYAVHTGDGSPAWKYSTKGSWVLTTAAVKDGMVYFGTSDSYLFIALEAKTGIEQFRFRANGYVYSSPIIAGNTAYFGDFTGSLFAVDLSSRGLSWQRFSTKGRKANASVVLNKKGDLDFTFAAGTEDPVYYATGVKVMEKLYTLGPIVSTPVIAGDIIYFGSADSSLYAEQLER